MVYETVFWCVVLGLKSTEEGFFGTKDLDSTCRMFGKTEQTTCVTDESCTNELANESGKIRCNGIHSISEIFRELGSVSGDRDDLVAKRVNVGNIGIRYFSTHGDFSSGLENCFKVFGENRGK